MFPHRCFSTPSFVRPEEVSKHTDSNLQCASRLVCVGCVWRRARERAPSRPSLRAQSVCRRVRPVRACICLCPARRMCVCGHGRNERGPRDGGPRTRSMGRATAGRANVIGSVRSLSVRIGASSSCARLASVLSLVALGISCVYILIFCKQGDLQRVGKPCAASTILTISVVSA